MTIQEIEDIVWIVSSADGGCPVCVRKLMEQLAARFPEFSFCIYGDEVDAADLTKAAIRSALLSDDDFVSVVER